MNDTVPRVNRRSALAFTAAAAAGTLLPGCSGQDTRTAFVSAQVLPSTGNAAAISNARESAWTTINSGQGSGVSVAIMERGNFVYSETMGIADRALNRSVDRKTRFNIGSLSKMFATVAILLLVEDGKLLLDTPVVRYISEMTMKDARYRDITVRMLLNHSSGLPGTSFFIGFEPDALVHRLLFDTLKRSRLKHAPGAMSMYCNDGFTLAEIVVERVSGLKFVDFLGGRVFVPLGMADTTTSIGESGGDNVAEYYEPKSGKKYPREVLQAYATGGFSSTAEDLCRFGDNLMAGGRSLLSAVSLKELSISQATPFASALPETWQFAHLGWDYATQIGSLNPGLQVFAKGGNTGFYSANLQVLPTERMVIAMITSGQASADKLTDPILAGVLADRKIGNPARQPVQRRSPQPIPTSFDRFVGHYALTTGALKVTVDSERRKLMTTILGGASAPLEFSEGYFYNLTSDRRFYFGTRDGIDFISMNVGGLTRNETLEFQKLNPISNAPQLTLALQDAFWLIRNAPAAVEVLDFNLLQPLKTYDELPGYVDFAGIRRTERPDFAAMAGTALRDQTDLELIEGKDGSWLRTGHLLWSSARLAEQLPLTSATITIGVDGFNEWRAVAAGAVRSFTLPAKGRVMVLTLDAMLYDSLIEGITVYTPAGSYVFFAGAAGDVFQVTAK